LIPTKRIRSPGPTIGPSTARPFPLTGDRKRP
jgi:hypothetical protein